MAPDSSKKTPRQRVIGRRRHEHRRGPGEASAFSSWQARHTKGSPETQAEVKLYPPRVYTEEINRDLPGYDDFGLPAYPSRYTEDERMTEILRFLGRTYVCDIETLHRMLYYPRFDIRTTYRDIETLMEHRHVWHAEVRGIRSKMANNGMPGRPRKIFGLSRTGKQLLQSMAIEADATVVEQMVARDPRGKLPKPSSLGHDLQVTWWCASMIEGLRLVPWCTSIYCQTEFRSSKTQRADAMLVARFNFEHPRENLHAIPWFDGSAKRDDEIEVRWALELDNSTESVGVLIDKFVMYRDLHGKGVYHKLFSGEVLLVLLVQDAKRADYLATEFSRAWPEGWGLVSTPDRQGARARSFGALWGRYFSMTNEAEVNLLSVLVRNPVTGGREYQALMTHELWMRYLELRQQRKAPASWYDLLDAEGV